MAIGPRFPVKPPENFNIPREWQHLVCLCPEDEGTKHDLEKSIYMLCRKCSKFKRFYASRCRECKEFYLMVFKHPYWAPTVNWCWDCLDNIDWPTYAGAVPPPEWVKPKPPMTTEEIDSILDDFTVVDSGVSVDFDF